MAKLGQAIDDSRTALVQRRVADALRSTVKPASRADELLSFAVFIRDIRNYGVHPRENGDPQVESYFSEHDCGLLLMQVRSHLQKLASAVTDAVEKRVEAGASD